MDRNELILKWADALEEHKDVQAVHWFAHKPPGAKETTYCAIGVFCHKVLTDFKAVNGHCYLRAVRDHLGFNPVEVSTILELNRKKNFTYIADYLRSTKICGRPV